MIWLIFAHFFGDFAFQSDIMSIEKGRRWYVLGSHAMIWTACISIALAFQFNFAYWKAIFLFLGHFTIDMAKTRLPKEQRMGWGMYLDQFLHLCQLFIVNSSNL